MFSDTEINIAILPNDKETLKYLAELEFNVSTQNFEQDFIFANSVSEFSDIIDIIRDIINE